MFKDKKMIFIYSTTGLTLVTILLQILAYFSTAFVKVNGLVTTLLLFIIAPITFFIIASMLKKEPKVQIKLWKKIAILLVFTIVYFIVVIVLTHFVNSFNPTTTNPIVKGIQNNSVFIRTIIVLAWSMFAEEAVKLSLLFVVLKDYKYSTQNRSRYWVSWIVVSILFGLLHLQTYNYNIIQCLILIGLPTMMFGYLWKKTASPYMTWGAHYLFDVLAISIAKFATALIFLNM
ncbi:hypothetical protein SAMN02745245_01572 [Anaerosphaera aminiphila DSM 21120]|uniref:CAAX prenyl protease 2/Lysostaphin resistance protein A-like domain-containing protein n=1 Tax=Anaerosphaera aminiphila DSM 21120 TaxID=1120995 RepID=A0A1M5TU29_9FIRM|nr:CPBP family glutamic-type intramembrane protease [Anaerosphaera aminiphila]SHH54325.1 hypothetical protein SAMN02745245_01572 [Anaerosphaera aminiphila DSM 21120]